MPRLTKEKLLRYWLLEVMGTSGQVQWVEPAFGSTVGLPDALVKISNVRIPVELKFWDQTSRERRIKAKMRPAQIRYHVMAARNGEQTAILYTLKKLGDVEADFDVFLLCGKYCPLNDRDLATTKAVHIGTKHGNKIIERKLFINTMLSSSFWM